jgi:hypothetical protein
MGLSPSARRLAQTTGQIPEMRPLGDTFWRGPSRFFPPARSGRPPMRDAAGANYSWLISKVRLPVLRV